MILYVDALAQTKSVDSVSLQCSVHRIPGNPGGDGAWPGLSHHLWLLSLRRVVTDRKTSEQRLLCLDMHRSLLDEKVSPEQQVGHMTHTYHGSKEPHSPPPRLLRKAFQVTPERASCLVACECLPL